MNATVEKSQAEEILRSAIDQVKNHRWKPKGPYSNKIKLVILGTHKTYRYILLNGLLAKATNRDCNPLALQVRSTLDGAFDARSLCHKVVVPIERELLGGRLGASNEPFLNKPARFTELSNDNAVRRGNDTLMLHTTIEVLSNIKSSQGALTSLKNCIYWIFERESRNLSDYLAGNDNEFQQSSLISFSQDLISVSAEGETCALLAGVIFNLVGQAMGRDLEVKVHKINQAGSSSNEVSDVDVYEDNVLVYTAEIKDKIFSPQDVEHAISKVAIAGHKSLIFIKGPRSKLSDDTESNLSQLWMNQGFNLYFVDIIDYFTSVVSFTPNVDQTVFMEWLNQHADTAKVKDETFSQLTKCAQKQNW